MNLLPMIFKWNSRGAICSVLLGLGLYSKPDMPALTQCLLVGLCGGLLVYLKLSGADAQKPTQAGD